MHILSISVSWITTASAVTSRAFSWRILLCYWLFWASKGVLVWLSVSATRMPRVYALVEGAIIAGKRCVVLDWTLYSWLLIRSISRSFPWPTLAIIRLWSSTRSPTIGPRTWSASTIILWWPTTWPCAIPTPLSISTPVWRSARLTTASARSFPRPLVLNLFDPFITSDLIQTTIEQWASTTSATMNETQHDYQKNKDESCSTEDHEHHFAELTFKSVPSFFFCNYYFF